MKVEKGPGLTVHVIIVTVHYLHTPHLNVIEEQRAAESVCKEFVWVSGADTGFMKGGGTVYETLPEAVHRGV